GAAQPWYESGWVAVIARNVTAIVIALLVLIMGVRPLSKVLMKRSNDAGPRLALGREMGGANNNGAGGGGGGNAGGPPVSVDAMADARNYDDRIGMVRGFTRDNPARAALAVRDMIKADAK
ncbi:MAG: flagellar M-ring protein FliF, partial [Sphingomonas sp.]